MTAFLPSETQLTSGEQHSAPHIHHALPHFSPLRITFPSTCQPTFFRPYHLPFIPGVALSTTSIMAITQTNKTVHFPFSLYGLRRRRAFPFSLLRTYLLLQAGAKRQDG